jgi:hypothetical protein
MSGDTGRRDLSPRQVSLTLPFSHQLNGFVGLPMAQGGQQCKGGIG